MGKPIATVTMVGEVLIAPTSQVVRVSAKPSGQHLLEEFRCPSPDCRALLFKGRLRGEIKCRACGNYLLIGL